MKRHRFFSPVKINDGVAPMKGASIAYNDSSQQWQKVLRLSRGEQVILFDGSGYDFLCEIDDFQGKTVILKVIERNENRVKAVRKIVLYVALVKKDIFEWIAQKATELGVSDIVPIIAERSEKKNINMQRLLKIIIEAAEQSGRGSLPNVGEVRTLTSLLTDKDFLATAAARSVVFDPHNERFSREELKSIPDPVNIFIGPEGGWSPNEVEAFKKAGMLVRALGPQILRTETAVVAALAQLVF